MFVTLRNAIGMWHLAVSPEKLFQAHGLQRILEDFPRPRLALAAEEI